MNFVAVAAARRPERGRAADWSSRRMAGSPPIDLKTGDIAWQVANGDTPPAIRDHPLLKGVTVPRTGSRSRAGLLATRTLLFAGEGWGGQPFFRALDKATGATVWETAVPARADRARR